MNTIGKELPDYIRNHEKIGLAIPWNKYFLEIPELRDHLENMHKSPLFEIGLFNYLDISKIIEDFKVNPVQNYSYVRSLFFNSYWYQVQFNS
jgi:asparagine synthase (glutamine-hydrolysing)